MNKKYCIISQLVLLVWFFLDMTGLHFGNQCLVTTSYKDDGIFFGIYLLTVIIFILKDNIGKWLVTIWLSMWFIIQFMCHEWYTIFGSGLMGTLDSKIKYFSGTIQWFSVNDNYIPDVYHTILHLLIVINLSFIISYIVKHRKTYK